MRWCSSSCARRPATCSSRCARPVTTASSRPSRSSLNTSINVLTSEARSRAHASPCTVTRMSSTERIRLLIVGGDLDAIKQLRQQLQPEPAVDVVGHALAPLEAIRLAAQEKPDVVCIDLEALGSEGIAICEAIAARLPDLRVVMILPHGQTDADLMRRAMRSGVRELLVRPFNAAELVESLRRAQHLEPKPDEGFEAHRQHEPE